MKWTAIGFIVVFLLSVPVMVEMNRHGYIDHRVTSAAFTSLERRDFPHGQLELILFPTKITPEPAPLVIYQHGAGEKLDVLTHDALKRPLIDELLRRGYMVADTQAHDNNWGNEESIKDYVHLYRSVCRYHDVKDVVFLSQSMGGLSGLLALQNHEIPVKAWCGIYPVTNLASMFLGSTYRGDIANAYRMDPHGEDYDRRTAGHDPSLLAAPTIPMLIFASPDDTIVPADLNGFALAKKTAAKVVICRGQHGDPSHFQPSVVADFFDRALHRN